MKLSRKFKCVASIALAAALVIPTMAVSSDSGAAKKIVFSKKSITVKAGKTKTVTVKNCKKTAKTKFTTSDKSVATVTKVKKQGNKAKVKGIKAGTARITCKLKKKTASITVKVTGKTTASTGTQTGSSGSSNNNSGSASGNKDSGNKGGSAGNKDKDNTPAVPTYPPGYVYKQRAKEVTRWYKPGEKNGHPHDGYRDNNFAIWMIGFYDNDYDSTNDEKLNSGIYGPTLDDYKGKALTVKGEFMYEGTSQKTVLLQLNYTSPVDYPIVWKWEKGASKNANEYAAGLKMSGVNGSENVDANTWAKVNATFTIPTDAKNGDKDDEGRPYGIYLYFPNKPGGALLYRDNNTFHFKNFEIK